MRSSPTDFKNCCRICAKTTNKLTNVFTTRKKGISLAEMISYCTQLSINQRDNRPSKICGKCMTDLKVAYKLCNLAKASEERFQQIDLSQQIAPPFPFECVETLLDKDEIKQECSDDNKETFSPLDEVPKTQIEIDENEKTLVIETIEIPAETERSSRLKVRKTKEKIKSKIKTKIKKQPKAEVQKKIKKFWECHKCKIKPSLYIDLLAHIKNHAEATSQECIVCGMYFSAKSFKRHLCKGKRVQCEYCPKSFKTTHILLQHLELHKNEHVINRCIYCKKSYPMKLLMEFHLWHHHTIKSYRCDFCSFAFDNPTQLQRHRYCTHIAQKSESFKLKL